MKTLTLLRHAKSELDSPSGDFERSLSDRGRADSCRIGTEIRNLGLRFDLVLASPARRVVETLTDVSGLSPKFDRRIYNAATDELLEIVRATDDGIDRLLLVGHNLGMERLAARLTGSAVDQLPTGTLAEIGLAGGHWRDAGKGSGRLVRILRPKDLA